jgi:hypothetical protein
MLVAGPAQAAPPTLLTVGQQNRHAAATFTAPGADFGTIYIATGPYRATDGSFLNENVETSDFLTADELQYGAWLDESQIDPGHYFVMLSTSDFDCGESSTCSDGFSEVKMLDVPEPPHTYRGQVHTYSYIGVVTLRLTVSRLGERMRYRVCWPRKGLPRRCVSAVVDGYSWNSSASGEVDVAMRGMRARTTFTWYVDGRVVATRTAATTRA